MYTIKALSFFADGEYFAADISLIQKVARKLKVTPVLTAPCEVTGIANIKGKVITILNISALIKQTRPPEPEDGQITVNAVVFKSFTGTDQIGLIADSVCDLIEIEEQQPVPAPAADETEEFFHISKVADINGILYKIININSIINRFETAGRYNQ